MKKLMEPSLKPVLGIVETLTTEQYQLSEQVKSMETRMKKFVEFSNISAIVDQVIAIEKDYRSFKSHLALRDLSS